MLVICAWLHRVVVGSVSRVASRITFSNLALGLKPVLIRLAIVPASLLIDFIGPRGNLGCTIESLLKQQRGPQKDQKSDRQAV
jgi:hypothetical protein